MIIDHSKRPRNFHNMADATRRVEGYNPLCGDKLALFVKMDGDKVQDVSFIGAGCAISTASASLMTESVKGKSREEAEPLMERFHDLLTTEKPQVRRSRQAGGLLRRARISGPRQMRDTGLAYVEIRADRRERSGVHGMRDKIIDALRTVFDPEIPMNIWDLGLIYDVTSIRGRGPRPDDADRAELPRGRQSARRGGAQGPLRSGSEGRQAGPGVRSAVGQEQDVRGRQMLLGIEDGPPDLVPLDRLRNR